MELKIKELPVSETNYESTMKNVVEPYLDEIRKSGYFRGCDQGKIHYEQYMLPDPSASVVIVHGFTESAEKFREMVYNFTQMNFNVFVYDQRGHGFSTRLIEDSQTVAVEKFSDYVEDLLIFVKEVVVPLSPKIPKFVYAHSMGGAVAIQFLQTYPEYFDKAVLSAPMIMCKCGSLSPQIAKSLAASFCELGMKNKRVFSYDDFNPKRSYETSHDTSKARFEYYHQKRIDTPEYQTCSPTYGWVFESLKIAKKNLDRKRCMNIKVPVLLCQPEEDTSVYSEKENEFMTKISNGKLVQFKNCKHEIYASVDETLFEYLVTIEKFLKN